MRWQLRREVGIGPVEPPVPDDDAAGVERGALMFLDGRAAVPGDLPGDALRDEPAGTRGRGGSQEIARSLAPHPRVRGTQFGDTRPVVRKVRQLMQHHVRRERDHRFAEGITIEHIADDRLRTEPSQPLHLGG